MECMVESEDTVYCNLQPRCVACAEINAKNSFSSKSGLGPYDDK